MQSLWRCLSRDPSIACCMCAQPREAARARSMFADGRLRLALTTERAHFFLRIRTRGVKARLSLTWLPACQSVGACGKWFLAP